MAIYREDDYWIWKVVDAGGREIFASDICLTRDDAVNSLEAALNLTWPRLDNREN